MSLQTYTNGQIILDGQPIALHVSQGRDHTVVFLPAGRESKYRELPMPHKRYTLAYDTSDKPGVQGCLQFEADIRALLQTLT